MLSLLVLVGCAKPIFSEGTTYWNRFVSGSYSFSTFRFLARKNAVLIQVKGRHGGLDNNIFSQKLVAELQKEPRFFDLELTAEPVTEGENAARLLFILSPRKDASFLGSCGEETAKSLSQTDASGRDLEVLAVYCRRDRYMSTVRMSVTEFKGLSDERFGGAARGIARQILPYRHPERGRGCSNTVTTDC